MVPVERIPDRQAAERELKGFGDGLGGLGERDAGRGRQALGVDVARRGGDEQEPVSPGAAGAAGAVARQAQCREQVDLVDLGHCQMQAAVCRRERGSLGPQERQHLAGRQAQYLVEDAGQRERQRDGDPDQQHGGGGKRDSVPPPRARVAVRSTSPSPPLSVRRREAAYRFRRPATASLEHGRSSPDDVAGSGVCGSRAPPAAIIGRLATTDVRARAALHLRPASERGRRRPSDRSCGRPPRDTAGVREETVPAAETRRCPDRSSARRGEMRARSVASPSVPENAQWRTSAAGWHGDRTVEAQR